MAADIPQRDDNAPEGWLAICQPRRAESSRSPFKGKAESQTLEISAVERRARPWVGDKDLACEELGIAIRFPSSPSYGELKLLPFWDPLRGDPCFEKIVASLAPK